ncbi:S-layer homology domain-containing protein [Vallitalea pronyensis]|uniref:S-layer homology domain-containing protein n=1 Tax=Vallitalea pronyensis TaxID=1348613 RepID=A0A8J8MNE0_9FIRM|nr:S-layer homology domain-containing protein [Vallitalea pronyensis]QUI24995.1 S-layer homology domain-containing protein [Vallitalea pronyensis]
MRHVKKLVALVIAVTMLVIPVSVNAATLEEQLVAKFVATVQGMSTDAKEGLVVTVEAFLKADDKASMKQVVTDMYNQLLEGQKQRFNTYLEVTSAMDMISELADYVETQTGDLSSDIANLRGHLGLSGGTTPSNTFAEALNARNFGTALSTAGLTVDKIGASITKIAGLYDDLQTYKNLHSIGYGDIKIVNLNTTNNQMFINSGGMTTFIGTIETVKKEPIENKETFTNAFNVVIAEYNTGQNRVAIAYLLDNYSFIYRYSTGGGGNDPGTDPTPTPTPGGDTGTPVTSDPELDKITEDLANGNLDDNEVADKVAEVVDKVVDSLDNVTDQNGAYAALKSVSAVLESTEKVINALDDEEAVAEVVEQVAETLDSTITALEFITNSSSVTLKAKALIADVAKINNVVTDDEQGLALEEAALELAEVAIEKSGIASVSDDKVKVQDGKATADLSTYDYAYRLSKVKDTAKDMEKLLVDSKIDGNRELAVSLTLQVPATQENVEIALPDLEDAFEAVDMVKVETETAAFTVGVETFTSTKDIVLSADTVATTQLSATQKAALPSGVKNVIDLNATVAGEQVTTFGQAIQVTVPYTLSSGQDPEKVSFYLLTDEGTIEKVAGKYDPATGQVTVSRKHFSKYFVNVSNDTFGDIGSVEWARQAIEVLAGKGIINGKGDDVFAPKAKITRAEFVALISRMLQLEANDSVLPFDDVDTSKWYAQDVAAAYQNGIIAGKSSNAFAPMATITRQEAAKVINNALNHVGIKSETDSSLIDDKFVDMSSIANWADDAIATVYREGIIKGKPGNVFDPSGDATRAEVAMMVYKLYFLY